MATKYLTKMGEAFPLIWTPELAARPDMVPYYGPLPGGGYAERPTGRADIDELAKQAGVTPDELKRVLSVLPHIEATIAAKKPAEDKELPIRDVDFDDEGNLKVVTLAAKPSKASAEEKVVIDEAPTPVEVPAEGVQNEKPTDFPDLTALPPSDDAFADLVGGDIVKDAAATADELLANLKKKAK